MLGKWQIKSVKDAEIIAQIQLYPHLSIAKLANKLQISQARLLLRLDRFRQVGVLVREGAKKNGRWSITDKFGGCDADGNLLVRIGVPLDPKLGMKVQKVADARGVPLDVVMQEMLAERVHNDHVE
jgi:DNA-binding Lrp family transcriptional regulator